MILIADSGGSKTDWRLLKKDGTIGQAHTPGFNPYYQPIDHLYNMVRDSLVAQVGDEPVKKIFYYASGASSDKNKAFIRDTFQQFFPGAEVEIDWDLMAAARALCGHEPGIACIIGTGSNTCLYDGEKITHQVANLGWILADEGSGTNIGRKFLKEYLRGKLPENLAAQFKARYPFTREEFLEKVYHEEKPSAFLASFMKFIFQHVKEPYCYQLVYNSFAELYEENVMRYPGYKDLKVHFTGSVAFYFSDILRQVANDRGITVKNILETPIAGLALFHQKDIA
jgi:N-acetylglucosamine kinase-like BadF-type ATPase